MKHLNRLNRTTLAILASLPPLFHPMLADSSSAKAFLDEAHQLITTGDIPKATAKLELAEAEIEDAPAAEKAAFATALKAARSEILARQSAADLPKYKRKLGNLLDDAEGAIGNLATWPGTASQLAELLANPAVRALLPAETEAAEKKFATFRKLHGRKAAVELAGRATDLVTRLESTWKEHKPLFADPDSSPNSRESAIDDTQRDADRARQLVSQLPPEDEVSRQLLARIDLVVSDFSGVALAGKAAEFAARFQENLASYRDDFEGWEKEAGQPAPTWDAYTRETSRPMSAFKAPRTVAFRDRAADILRNLAERSDYKAVADAAAVKAPVAALQAKLDQASTFLAKRVQPIAAAALKAPIKDPNDLSRLSSDIRLALGEDSPVAKDLMARIQARIDANEAATSGAANATEQLIATLRTKADEAWPTLQQGLKGTTEIDLSKPGQAIRFTADNLMGYRFKPGDFYFATTLSGFPVAARFDPSLQSAIKAIEERIDRSIGDSDDDGKWEVFAIVTSKKARLLARRQIDAKGTIEGLDVRVKGEYADPVDAVVIDIVAAKCGPFAGAKGRGTLKPDGSVAP